MLVFAVVAETVQQWLAQLSLSYTEHLVRVVRNGGTGAGGIGIVVVIVIVFVVVVLIVVTVLQ